MREISFRINKISGRGLLTAAVLILFIFICGQWVSRINAAPQCIDFSAAAYSGKLVIKDPGPVLKIYGEIKKARRVKGGFQIKGNYKLNVVSGHGTQTFIFDQPGLLLETGSGRILQLNNNGECLKPFMRELEEKFRYGKMLPWNQVHKIFPKFAKAAVVDLETGMSFRVQRRAGSQHADVQPLTAADSAVMKQIYGGRWSWNRRAVIVEINGYRLAASMNGMPHGAGAIYGNKFDGHFCIHFLDSRLHTHGQNTDRGHQLMVWKAAGKINEILADAGPEEIAAAMLTALAQSDIQLALDMVQTFPTAELTKTAQCLKKVTWFAADDFKQNSAPAAGTVEVEARVSFQMEGGPRIENRKVALTLVKARGKYPWQVVAGTVLKMLDKNNDN